MTGLGDELSRYRPHLRPLLALYPVTAVGALCLAAVHPALAFVALVPLGILTWLLVSRGKDRLVVHRDGFAVHHRGTVRSCRWDDVERVDTWLDGDNRPRIRWVTTRDGDAFRFLPFMGGLAELHRAYLTRGETVAPAVAPRNAEGIGALVSTHRPAKVWGYLPIWFLAGGVSLLGLLVGFLALDDPDRSSGDGWIGVGCTAGSFGFAALVLWFTLPDRGDELRIHEHGFAYQHRGAVLDCRWDEIANYRSGRYCVHAVMRDDGTWIELSADILETRQYIDPRVRSRPVQ